MSEIIQQKAHFKPEPFNYSKYERTYNTAIDLVAQAIGYARKNRVPLKAIILRPQSYYLFKAGVEALCKSKGIQFDPNTELTFDNVAIKLGSGVQFDTMKYEYYLLPKA